MAYRNNRKGSNISRRQRWMFVRLALAAAVAAMIIARYTSPRSLFNPVSSSPPIAERK